MRHWTTLRNAGPDPPWLGARIDRESSGLGTPAPEIKRRDGCIVGEQGVECEHALARLVVQGFESPTREPSVERAKLVLPPAKIRVGR